ncbi:MAG: response regulator, partial [Verrucomicrobiota bacterium]
VNQEKADTMASILIIEDDATQLKLYAEALAGYQLTCVSTGTAGLKAVVEAKPDLIILDNVLESGERGVDFLPGLKQAAAHVPVILISGTVQIREQLTILQGPHSVHFALSKPFDLDDLKRTVEIALTECGFGEMVASLQSLERAEKITASEPDRRFTERLARHHEMIKRLHRAAERANISGLSRDFGVSRRTIIRDLQDLIRRGQLPEKVYPERKPDPAPEE